MPLVDAEITQVREPSSTPAGNEVTMGNPSTAGMALSDTARNKTAAIAAHTQAIPGNHAEALAALVGPGFLNHDAAPGAHGDLSGLLATMHWFSDAFSDQRVEVLHAVAEEDMVALHIAFSGRHTGYFRGVAPSGRRFTVEEMHLLRFADGREVEHWAVRDDASLAHTLDALRTS